jgi:hypothetical protein
MQNVRARAEGLLWIRSGYSGSATASRILLIGQKPLHPYTDVLHFDRFLQDSEAL